MTGRDSFAFRHPGAEASPALAGAGAGGDFFAVRGQRPSLVPEGLEEGAAGDHGAGANAVGDARAPPPPPLSRTNRTRHVPHPVLIGHAASLTPY